MSPEVAATWQAWSAVVQAGGSIAAIAFAIWIANRQHEQNIELVRDERRRTEEQDRRRDEAIREMARDAIDIVTEALEAAHRDHGRAKALAYEGAEASKIDVAADIMAASFRGLESAAGIVIWQFDELKVVYQTAGATPAIFHFHTSASLADIKQVANRVTRMLENHNYAYIQFELEPIIQELYGFQASITEHFKQL
ncbi:MULTISPECIES: hypothetical protein [Xanthomonas]|nr:MULTISPECIES: hypothetical protein [Xanthomonas]ATS38433.1 hypothetical protein XcfCFBP6988P_10105 [Xanthomonas citri pv. phaseoli var. fuscans]ATS42767.1 hypothetical protein XcfCFBP6989P_10380 [Xanthomonas citri pv. phaseoli var. fuscans]ATS46433.1 hypothetical protein XcfCFBP6990P_06975 [Xanthomonas citri pv. phaseoli var. fuscans]ATS83309.1 hypothetical protein XcfCFBP6991P_04490 [Xanthomonas citri pv. phaseoli var. fuscans]QWN20092.1 hypothetical protein DGM98_07975 [Xanthomonas citri]